VKGLSRKAIGLDSTAGDAQLEGGSFVSGVHAEGRFDRSDADELVFAWSGSRISARFSGTSAGAVFDDAGGKNQFGIIVDGKLRPAKLSAKRGKHAYLLAAGLTPGEHEVTVHRLTEANLGETKFLGFRFGKEGAALPTLPLGAPHRGDRRFDLTTLHGQGGGQDRHFSRRPNPLPHVRGDRSAQPRCRARHDRLVRQGRFQQPRER
jgi:hypothetical protein